MKNQIDDLGVVGVVVEDWDISREYKAKTITTDYSTWIVYISRKNVPAYTPITDNNYWKPLTRLTTELAFNYNTFKEVMERKIDDLTLQVNTFLSSIGGNLAISKEFGDNDYLAVSQRTLTDAINKLWDKFEELTGEHYQGINMIVNPKYFISEEGAKITVQAATADTNGKFENIRFTLNGEEIYTADNVEDVTFVYPIELKDNTDKYILTCYAKIMGITYTAQEVITHYNSFWLGTGKNYEEVMINDNLIPVKDSMRGAYNVTVKNDGDFIIIVVGESLQSGFLRADLNGMEIPMSEESVTIEGEQYRVFKSSNAYLANDYNIDING